MPYTLSYWQYRHTNHRQIINTVSAALVIQRRMSDEITMGSELGRPWMKAIAVYSNLIFTEVTHEILDQDCRSPGYSYSLHILGMQISDLVITSMCIQET
jgi:hypothetical protein